MRGFPVAFAAGAAAAALLVGAAPLAASPRPVKPVKVDLPTAVRTPLGIWATVPMGHLDQPLNTFWQLLFEPAGRPAWSDLVEATGVATNGGIVLAASKNRLVVGIRPSNLLTYSPLLATANAGRSWSTGLLAQGLASVPSALAAAADGYTMALPRGGPDGPEVLGSPPGHSALSSWKVLLSSEALAAAGGSCQPLAVTAVGYAGDRPVVGALCARAGSLGLFVEQAGHWSLSSPKSAGRAGAPEVLGLVGTPIGLAAVDELQGRGGSKLLAAWNTSGEAWRSSAYLPLPGGANVASIGPASGSGVFVLLATGAGKQELAVAEGPAGPWKELAAPPAGTETVAFAAQPQALAVHQNTLDVWRLSGGHWQRVQVLRVPIQYGSSS